MFFHLETRKNTFSTSVQSVNYLYNQHNLTKILIQRKIFIKMNLLKQSLQRFNLTTYQTAPLSKFSTATNVQAVDEYDKLYKTVELELKGNDPAVLKSFAKFASTAGNHFDIQSKSWSLRKPKHERHTVLKSVHIYKKHMVQYELRTYFTFVQFKHLTGSTADTLLEYVQRNLPEGVALKTSKVELQTTPEHLVPPS